MCTREEKNSLARIAVHCLCGVRSNNQFVDECDTINR
jgi:hypothetical protein